MPHANSFSMSSVSIFRNLNISLSPISGVEPKIFLLGISRSRKNQLKGYCKISYSIFSNKHIWYLLKSRYSIIHRRPNDSTLYKSYFALRIIQGSTNLSTLCKSFEVAQIFLGSKNSLNVV